MKIAKLLSLLNKKVPFRHCEKWDNAGLAAGDSKAEITGMIAVLDLSEEAVDYAVKNECNLIIAHHPLIFKPIYCVRSDDHTGALLTKLIKNSINLIVLHTNFDKSIYNQSYNLARKLGLDNLEPLSITDSEYLCKLSVFVPPQNCDALKNAVFEAGAGKIGRYSRCAYTTEGHGEFMGGADSNPFTGRPLEPEKTKEIKLEAVFNENLQAAIVEAVLKNHPYEEPAYDIIQLKNKCKNYGYGIYGEFTKEITFEKFIDELKKITNISKNKTVFTATGSPPVFIKKTAIVNGSGFDFYKKAIEKKCDVFISGDITYHRALELKAAGLFTIDCSHFATEANFGECLETLINEIETEENCPLNYKKNNIEEKNPLEII